MRVFVTGGAGFIGSVVVRQLLGQGHAVRCLVLPGTPSARLEGLDCEQVPGDVRDPDSVHRSMSDCQAVVHLASISNWQDIDSPRMDAVVVGGTRHILSAARAVGGLRTVFVSTAIAIGGTRRPVVQDETSPCRMRVERYSYMRAKRAAEALCRQAADEGQPVVIVNPGEVYGPNDFERVTAGNLIDFARSSTVLVCAGGTAIAHVDDVATGIVAALSRGRSGERYILAGENLSVRALAALTLELLGQKKTILQAPNALVSALAWLGRTIKLPLPFDPHVIPYATRYWFMSSAKAERELGVTFRPARETLAPTLSWLRESGVLS
jgi:dihydroflavonol-4-reductase